MRAQLGVEVCDRFVEQEQLGFAHDGPPYRHALLLAARQFVRAALEQMTNFQKLGRTVDPFPDRVLRSLAQPERVCDVFKHRLVRVESVVFEHHRDIAVFRCQIIYTRVVKQDVSGADVLKACQHPHGRRLAATRRTQDRDEASVRAGQVQFLDRRSLAIILPDILDRDGGHDRLPYLVSCGLRPASFILLRRPWSGLSRGICGSQGQAASSARSSRRPRP